MGCRICELLSDQSQHGNHHNSEHVIMTPPNHMLLPQLREMLLAAYLLRGYYQPAGPLISAHHHHNLPKPSVLPTLEASPTSTPPTLNAPPSAPPASTSSGTRGGDESSDNDVVITATSCSNPNYQTPANQAPPTYRYQAYALPPTAQHIHHQYPYTQYPQQYYPAGVQAVQYSGAPPPQQHHYHNPEICYSAPNYPPAPPYYHHKSYSTPPPVSYPRRYGPPHPPAQYYPPDLYPQPSEQQSSRQMVATASTSGYQPPVDSYPPPPAPPVVPMVDPYPAAPPAPYYPGYPPPAPPCYSHSPPARSLAYIDTAYQGCPCPMQSCPKNVHTGPPTGEGKGPDPSAALFHQVPLPPVALALPLEPPQMMGPPSPARGSAGMHPTPSTLATAQGNDNNGAFTGKQEPYAAQIASESRAVIQDLSLKNIGLLTIHKPPSEPKSTVLEVVNVGTVNVGNNVQTLTRDFEQQSCDFTKVDPKVENNVKVEVGNVDGESKAVVGNAKKRKMKSENAAAPKPKRRNVDVAKKVSPKSKKLVQGDVTVNSLENIKVTSQKAKCKNQPLSSANSCSLHNSKQNAKKRKLNNVEILAENQEPAPVPAKVKLAKAKVIKEPKSRPKLCPPSKQQAKTITVAVSKNTVGITEPQNDQAFNGSTPRKECSNNIINIPTNKPAPKTASKTIPKTNPKSGPRATQKTIMNTNAPLQNRRKPTKSQLSKTQQVACAVQETLPKTAKTSPTVLNRKKLTPKAKLGKMQAAQSVDIPISVGKVKRRRQTETEATKVIHTLRRHGIQDYIRQTENDFNTSNMKVPTIAAHVQATATKCKVPAIKKQNTKNSLVPSAELTVYQPPVLKKGQFLKPKWSNGWCWEGEPFQAKVHLNSEESCAERICYPSMRHSEGDIIRPLDCVLLKSGARKVDLPFVAKVAQLWENPEDGEMMVSLWWYYRPEHTDQGRRPEDMKDEIFASKHKDINSVACIEDKCYVLTFNEYCRHRASSRRLQDGLHESCAVVPPTADYPRQNRQPPATTSPDMVFFCRRVYDFRQKRILKNPG